MPLHLSPEPTAQVIRFPNTEDEDREAAIAQLTNHQTVMITRAGFYLGRHLFLDAAVSTVARMAVDVDAVENARAALLEAFDSEVSLLLPGIA